MFDIRFHKFATRPVATVAWVVTLVGTVLTDLVALYVGYEVSQSLYTNTGSHPTYPMVIAVLFVAFSALAVLGVRLALEFVVVQFRQADHLELIESHTAPGVTVL